MTLAIFIHLSLGEILVQQGALILLIGEIGGSEEEEAAHVLQNSKIKKPAAAFISGRTAPAGRRMGHAGAIITGGKGTAEGKISALEQAGFLVAETPAVIGQTMLRAMKQ